MLPSIGSSTLSASFQASRRRAGGGPGLASVFVLAAALLFPACHNSPLPPLEDEARAFLDRDFGVESEPDIPFGSGAVRSPEDGEVDLLLDLYRPADGDRLPVLRPGLVIIHGGGFTGGTRKNTIATMLARSYAERGWFTVSIDYRLMDHDPPTEAHATDPSDPASVVAAATRIDAALAIQWLRDHADEYGIDPDRIAVMGFSAGAITALGVGYREPGPDAPDGADVGGVVSFSGGLYGTESIIDTADPPLILVHGVKDGSVPISQAEAVEARALEVGLTYDFFPLEGVGHRTPEHLDALVDGTSLEDRIAALLYQHLELEELAGFGP